MSRPRPKTRVTLCESCGDPKRLPGEGLFDGLTGRFRSDTCCCVQFPSIRAVSPGLIVNELFDVQPMSAPSGQIFYLDYRYDIKR